MSGTNGEVSGWSTAPNGESSATPARNQRWRQLPLIAFLIFAVMSVGAFFLTQKLKTAKPVVWHNPHPRPPVFDPVGGRICRVAGHTVNFRRTYLELSPTSTGRIAVYVYSIDGGVPVATLSRGRFMRAVPSPGSKTGFHRFYWNGRESDGRLAPAGKYFFRFVLLDLDDHAVDLTGVPVQLITSAHPPDGGCFPVSSTTG